MNILFLSRWFPWPPNNGARIRISNLLNGISSHHTVDLISFVVAGATSDLTQAGKYCRNVRVIPYEPFEPRRLKALFGFFSPWPRSVLDTHNPAMQQAIALATAKKSYDMVIASQIDMAAYALEIPNRSARVRILEEVELTTLYEQQIRESNALRRLRHRLMWQKWTSYINYLLARFDGYTAVSEVELQRIASVLQGKATTTHCSVIPNGIAIAHYAGEFGAPKPDTLIYSGALTYGANFDAVDFFLREIWPRVLAQRPQAHLFVTGRLEGVALDKLPQAPNVTFTGHLPDVRPAIAQSWASIVPLRIGGGTRLKILESLALRTPVIATQKGAEGLQLRPGEDILIADEPQAFAGTVLRLLEDAALRRQIGECGYRTVMSYDWAAVGGRLQAFFEQILPAE
ncbi:MAG: glycosyltransferase family 4 protein [Chloroflexota bacterium]